MKKTFLLFAYLLSVAWSFSAVRPAGIFADHMVLQRHRKIPVWGWAEPGEKLSIWFNKKSKSTIAGNDGKWMVWLDAEKAGGPYRLSIEAPSDTVVINDVLVGDVWICSGQSNMEFHVSEAANAEEEIRRAKWPLIRHIEIPKSMSTTPQDDIAKNVLWEDAVPAHVGHFTAVGYYFARQVHQQINVPIGLVHASWGGSMVETWISEPAFENDEEFRQMIVSLPELSSDSLKKPGVHPNIYPTLLFNGMIHPIIPYAIKGVLWYQGENNTEIAYQYRKTFPLMIGDWRTRWKQGDFPFYFVQVTSFIPGNASPYGSLWAELRESQSKALSVPNTGMAVTIDIGNAHDVHPKNKQDVGKRLAAIALHKTYKKKITWCGPEYRKMKIMENQVLLYFNYPGSGLISKNTQRTVGGFEIAADNGPFKKATALIEGDHVVVYSDEIAKPAAVRYGWKDDAGDATLFNKEGFPAAPFRTDNREGVTDKLKYSIKP